MHKQCCVLIRPAMLILDQRYGRVRYCDHSAEIRSATFSVGSHRRDSAECRDVCVQIASHFAAAINDVLSSKTFLCMTTTSQYNDVSPLISALRLQLVSHLACTSLP